MDGTAEGPAVGKMPYDGNCNEMLVMTSITDLNKLCLVFTLDHEVDKN